MMKKKILFCCLIVFIVLIVFILFINCLLRRTKKNTEVREIFKEHKSSFTEINNLMIEFLNDGQEGIYGIVKDDERFIVSLYHNGKDITLSDSQLKAINDIKKLYTTNFSTIYVSDDRIAYGGLGREMYVYTFDGKKPKYYYSKDGEDSFKTYRLSDNWYLLIRKTWP